MGLIKHPNIQWIRKNRRCCKTLLVWWYACSYFKRTGQYTTVVIADSEEGPITLFYSGITHTGENMEKIISQRPKNLGSFITMCDALSANTLKTSDTIESNCLANQVWSMDFMHDQLGDQRAYRFWMLMIPSLLLAVKSRMFTIYSTHVIRRLDRGI